MRPSSSSAAASRASASRSCSRRTRSPRRARRAARRAPASRSCGGGSRSRVRIAAEARPVTSLREARVVRAQVERAAVAAARPAGGSRAGRCSRPRGRGRAGRASAPGRRRVEPEPLPERRRPPGAHSTPSRPRCVTPRRCVASWASTVIANAASSRAPTLVLERDPVERAADRGLEVRELARDEGDARRVRADARERVAVVAAHGDRMAGDPRRFGREPPLGPGLVGRASRTASPRCGRRGRRRRRERSRSRARGRAAAASCAAAAAPRARGPARPPRRRSRPSRGRHRPRPGSRRSAGRGSDSVAPLSDPAGDELELHRREDHEREPERDRSLEPVGEQPGDDEEREPRRGRLPGPSPA